MASNNDFDFSHLASMDEVNLDDYDTNDMLSEMGFNLPLNTPPNPSPQPTIPLNVGAGSSSLRSRRTTPSNVGTGSTPTRSPQPSSSTGVGTAPLSVATARLQPYTNPPAGKRMPSPIHVSPRTRERQNASAGKQPRSSTPSSDGDDSSNSSNRSNRSNGSRHSFGRRMNQDEIQRQLALEAERHMQEARGRHVAGVTTTNTITTTFKDGGRPSVSRISTSNRS